MRQALFGKKYAGRASRSGIAFMFALMGREAQQETQVSVFPEISGGEICHSYGAGANMGADHTADNGSGQGVPMAFPQSGAVLNVFL